MGITGAVDTWLRNEGKYRHHCFISWPHTKNQDIADCARRVKEAVESELGASFTDPQVFLDETVIQAGNLWRPTLQQALCGSMCMVAICAPIYFRSEHHWCGLEWASMEKLADCRLPKSAEYTTIIPLIVRKSDPLPWEAAKIQYIDVSRLSLLGRRYFSTPDFRVKVRAIVVHIEKVAEELWRNRVHAHCDSFAFPTESAFLNYDAPQQRFPLVS